MTAAEALSKLVDHLLGENWYSIYMNTEDVYTDIVDTICSRYRGKKEDPVAQWRRRHKRCKFCRHIEYLDNPCGISAYKCRAKEKRDMSYENAIEILKNERPGCGEKITYTEEERYEAYNIAIHAIRKEWVEK